jgi:hypothetical protein
MGMDDHLPGALDFIRAIGFIPCILQVDLCPFLLIHYVLKLTNVLNLRTYLNELGK